MSEKPLQIESSKSSILTRYPVDGRKGDILSLTFCICQCNASADEVEFGLNCAAISGKGDRSIVIPAEGPGRFPH